MVFDPNNYFDIWNILAYEIIGGVTLTMIVGLVLIAFFSAKYQIPFQTGIALMVLYMAIISVLTYNIGLWSLVVLVVGGLFYWVLARMWRRN